MFPLPLAQVAVSVGSGVVAAETVSVLYGLGKSLFTKIMRLALRLAHWKGTTVVSSREIQTAVRFALPGELAKHAVSEGTKAVTKFTSSEHLNPGLQVPTDLVCVALGSCIVTTIAIVADRHQLDLTGSTYAVTKHMSQAPPRRIARIEVLLRLPAALAAADRKLLERTAHSCPVSLSLHPDVAQDLVFEYSF